MIRRMSVAVSSCLLGLYVVVVSVMAGPEDAMALTLNSPAFDDAGEIPSRYTCDGADVSPPLTISDIPDGTASLVLIVDDPDAPDPDAPKVTWVHWVVYNLPPQRIELPEGASGKLPGDAKEGINGWQRADYGGPCPPIGRHRYFFKVYALDTELQGLHKPDKSDIEDAMIGHIIEHAEMMGTYKKQAH